MKSIKEYIVEQLSYSKIFEMATELKEYREKIKELSPILIAHVLLILKAKEENSIEYVDHWKIEIKGFFKQFMRVKLKIKDTYKKRFSYIKKILIDEYEYDQLENLTDICYSKIYEEGYDLDDPKISKEFEELTKKFQDKYLDNMIDCMADHDLNKINNFVESLY